MPISETCIFRTPPKSRKFSSEIVNPDLDTYIRHIHYVLYESNNYLERILFWNREYKILILFIVNSSNQRYFNLTYITLEL
jgi:hypothetical protein